MIRRHLHPFLRLSRVFSACALGIVALACAPTGTTEAQSFRIGITGGVDVNYHTGHFSGLPGVPSCCPNYDVGNGMGAFGGVFFSIPFADEFRAYVRASYLRRDATFTANELTYVAVGEIPSRAVIEHDMVAQIGTVGIEPAIGYRLIRRLSVFAGIRAELPMRSHFDQKEVLVEPPTTGVFENGLRIRNQASGDIPDLRRVGIALMGGVSYDLPLNRSHSLVLIPEISYLHDVTTVVRGMTWHARTMRVGASIAFANGERETIPFLPPVPSPDADVPVIARESMPMPPIHDAPRDTLTPPDETAGRHARSTSPLVVDVTVARDVNSNSDATNPTLTVEEFTTTEMRPLLTFVFFAENSASIPMRYEQLTRTETSTFSSDRLRGLGSVDMYRHVLNIVGERLRNNPKARISLIGCNSNNGAEAGNTTLSRARAESIRTYLVRIWGIDAKRIAIEVRNLPAIPSTPDIAAGAAENRRVEIASQDWAIMQPILTTDVERRVSPTTLKFLPEVRSSTAVKTWKLTGVRGDSTIIDAGGSGMPPAILDWEADTARLGVSSGDSLKYSLVATDAAGRTAVSPPHAIRLKVITMERKRAERLRDTELSRYSLILFDFNSPNLNTYNQHIAEIIAKRIPAGSTVRITGYTDMLGDDAYNLKLSEERAKRTAVALKQPTAAFIGKGASTDLFDNSLPEGRFYSRTVIVDVESPVSR